MTYRTQDEAFRRVATLVRTQGVWPGVRKSGDEWELTYDPALPQPQDAG